MSFITPQSSEQRAGSSLAFVKPLPRRGDQARAAQVDSAEFDIAATGTAQKSALELWQKLLPDADRPGDSPSSCNGVMLGHFRIEERIGRGGMGAVFRAMDTRLDREVALKVLAGSQSSDSSAVERFLNEARSAARLDHDNVARVFYVGEEQGLHFIAFEFIHGANVRQVIDARGVLSPLDAVNYGLQIAHALRHISDAGVVHRDVKPSNIIITPTGRAKLVDLGLARKHDPEASKDLTVDGTTLGTFDYISPEQAKDPRKVDIRSDIYSLGCTLFHMLTGEPPYPQGTVLQKLLDHQHKDVPEAAARNGNVPPELSAVVRKMMASTPADRYATADELIGDLSILAHAYGLRPIAPGSLVWAVPGRTSGWTLLRRHRAWLATAGALLIAVFVIDMFQSDGPPADAGGLPVAQSDPVDQSPTGTSREEQPSTQTKSSPAEPDSQTAAVPTNPSHQARESGFANSTSLDAAESTIVDNSSSEKESPPRTSDSATTPPTTTAPAPALSQAADADDRPGGPKSSDPAIEESPVPSLTMSEVAELPAEPFVVRVDGAEPQGYVTLEAACLDAPDDSSIELNFDGPSTERQRPVRFTGKKLRIRPVAGKRPVVRFAAPQELTFQQIVRMISVNRGSLEVYNVDFIMEIDKDLRTDQWVFLSLVQAEAVTFRGVSVTVDNPLERSASIVELAESSSGFGDRMPEAMDRTELRLEAEDCFFRGQADLFLSENVDPARLQLRNVAVALDGSLIRFLGSEGVDVFPDMNGNQLVELALRHLTASLSGELARFEIDPGKSAPQLVVSAENSVIVLEDDRSLVSMIGDIDPFDAQKLLDWSGDHTFLESQDPVWTISGFEQQDFDLSEWNDLWKSGHLNRPDGFRLLSRDQSVAYDQITAVDLSLNLIGLTDNPARGGARDGTDAGVHWELPRLPRLTGSADRNGLTSSDD